MLLDREGHIILTDFGLSRQNIRRGDTGARSFCGSYAYLAPEVLRKNGHGQTVDWYLLGVMLYEMLTGLPPFYDDEKEDLFKNILHQDFSFDRTKFDVTDDCIDLLQRLLEKDPDRRLGRNGAEEVK